jgi:hypothetical protein
MRLVRQQFPPQLNRFLTLFFWFFTRITYQTISVCVTQAINWIAATKTHYVFVVSAKLRLLTTRAIVVYRRITWCFASQMANQQLQSIRLHCSCARTMFLCIALKGLDNKLPRVYPSCGLIPFFLPAFKLESGICNSVLSIETVEAVFGNFSGYKKEAGE